MSNQHHFEQSRQFLNVCLHCGREANNYEYHFPPPPASADIETHGHEFVYRSDHALCSICGGTHGIDDSARISALEADVKLLKETAGGGGVPSRHDDWLDKNALTRQLRSENKKLRAQVARLCASIDAAEKGKL